MKIQEAIKLLHPDTTRDALWKYESKEDSIKAIEKACLLACKALERQVPKKPIEKVIRDAKRSDIDLSVKHYYCPTCGAYLGIIGFVKTVYESPYCVKAGCGQRLDWSETHGKSCT